MSPGPFLSHACTRYLAALQVFTSASTVVFKTFGCDPDVVEGKSYLRADYSLLCETPTHTFYKIYAGFMLLVGRLIANISIVTRVLLY